MTQSVTATQLLEALANPLTYPERPARVEMIHTHISAVCIAGKHVYKVKKAVDFGFVDYSTLEKRRYYCEQEVELNRRLCPNLYLGVVKITSGPQGIRIGGEGAVIEYAVKMRLLPRERMLDVLLEQGEVTPAMIEQVSGTLARFHREAATDPLISAYGEPQAVWANAEENFQQTERYIGRTISQRQYSRIHDYTFTFINDHRNLFWERIAQGRIRDCHGDVHTQHVCFADRICIYDCIEFNERFRYGDVASEIAFLAMDLDFHHRGDLAQRLVEGYRTLTRDEGLALLLPFYACYRAYVRGKVESFQLDDPHLSEEAKARARERARLYFRLAYHYTVSAARPALFLLSGLPGTGKSSLARSLAGPLRAEVLSSDAVRKELAGIAPEEHRYESYGQGLYAPERARRTYDALLAGARDLLQQGRAVILDATYRDAAERRRAWELAQELGADAWVLECYLEEKLLRERLERRLAEETVSDAQLRDLPRFQADFEPIVEVPFSQHLRVDMAPPLEQVAQSVLDELPYGFPRLLASAPLSAP